MGILTHLSRLLVGVLFIISGLIKLNDPVGFSFKLEEYFSQGVLDLPFLMPYALAIALFVVVLEVLLGVALLLGYKKSLTLWGLFLMIVFFTFLTFYSAYFNKVTDCGCFGDALKLTPWESFTKDVVLLILILILLAGKKHIKPLFPKAINTIIMVLALVFCGWLGYQVLHHLPLKDFRPYKIGANIQEGMEIPENAPAAIYEYAWRFKVGDGEKVVVTQGDYPTVDGEFLDVETTLIQEGYEPPIHDFTIEKDGEDRAADLLTEPKLVMVIAYDLAKSDPEGFSGIKTIADKAMAHGYTVVGMSASSPEEAQIFIDQYQLPFEFYFTDQTTLKTIVRSNPGVLVLSHGTIQQKVHYNDLDALQFSGEPVASAQADDEVPAELEEIQVTEEALMLQLDSVARLTQAIDVIRDAGDKGVQDSLARVNGIPLQGNNIQYLQYWGQVDASNRAYAVDVLHTYGYPGKTMVGPEALTVVQGILKRNPDLIPQYLDSVQSAASAGEIPAWYPAELEDVSLFEQNKPQRYGTKGASAFVNGETVGFIWPIDEPETVNERRAAVGLDLSVEEYAKTLFGNDFEYKPLSMEEAKKLIQ